MVKKIALFAVWMVALSVFVFKMAYADCGAAKADGAKCMMACDKGSCAPTKMRHQKGSPKQNFVPAHKKA